MSVDKYKKVDGVEMRLQRFISILTPVNDYFADVLSDDKALPYIGQLTTMVVDDGDVVLVDSEDFESCFNLLRLPPQWQRFFAFASQ
eukprot:4250777-Amphidinium_carterae.1